MQYLIDLPFSKLNYFGKTPCMNMLNITRNAVLIPVIISLSSLIFVLITSTKTPIRVTLTTPYLTLMVEINSDKSPYDLNFLKDTVEVMIAADEE
jgi:hypothetical protein